MNIADKLRKVLEIKNNIKAALEEKGIENVGTDFNSYAESIANIKGGGDEPEEPEIPEFPKHEDVYAEALASIPEIPELEPWVQPEDWIDLRTVLAENVIEGYPHRVALLLRGSSETEMLGAFKGSKFLIKTSDGTIIDEAEYDGDYAIEYTWTNEPDENGYRWVIYYSDKRDVEFTTVTRENVVHVIFDNIRATTYSSNSRKYIVAGGSLYSSYYGSLKFKNAEAIESINGATIYPYDTSYYTHHSDCFIDCYKLVYISPDLLDDEFFNAKPYQLFKGCKSLKYLPNIRNKVWFKGNKVSFNEMFWGCSSLTSIPELDTSNGSSFHSMFRGCTSLTTIPELNTSNGTTFFETFRDCGSLITIPLIDTSNATDFSGMFYNCSSLITIPSIDNSSGSGHSNMFYSCKSLVAIPDNFLSRIKNEVSTASMFAYCNSLEFIDYLPVKVLRNCGGHYFKYIKTLDCSGVTSFSTSIGSTVKYVGEIINIPSDLTDFSRMFYSCESLVTIPPINTSNGTSFKHMFYGCKALKTIPELNTSNGTNFADMFENCSSLTSIPELNISNGTDFSYMFSGCSSLVTLPDLNTSNGTIFKNMFYNCSSLITIPSIDTSNNDGNFTNMFYGCKSLVAVPEIKNISNGTTFNNMFRECKSLKKFGDFITSPDKSVTLDYMFYNCTLDEIKSINVPLASSVKSFFGTAHRIGSISSTSSVYPSSYFDTDELHLPNNTSELKIRSRKKLKFRGNVAYKVTFESYYNSTYIIPTIEDIEIEPNTLSAEWDLKTCVCLSYNSIINILNALVQLEEGVVKTLKLNERLETLLTDNEIAIATDKGWTISFESASFNTGYV